MSNPDRPLPGAVIFGCSGPTLTGEEREFFRSANPLGLILFDYNCETPEQIAALTASFREAVGRDDAPVLIDQEGGRVARLKAPHWRHPPPSAVFAEAAKKDLDLACRAARLNARLMARDLRAVGVTVDCAPVIDVPVPGADDIIGDRALGADVETIAALGRAVCDGLLDEGVLPIVKHMPGHGRARADSHKDLPTVDEPLELLDKSDFATFRLLNDMPWAMTAHIVFPAVDKDRPATISPTVINEIIRGSIGFDGVVVSDDIGMEALSGTLAERATAVIGAGCDAVLECWGKLDLMREIAAVVPALSEDAAERVARAEAMRLRRQKEAPAASDDMLSELTRLLPEAGQAG
ncbi:MAG: beta-N-acetylhexosaminidase [Rhodospirillaceae bacterium]|nr:beta-N-acetylhexosaminidase [Rhodospirillaceae bacterium]